jgi:hypothetical protein
VIPNDLAERWYLTDWSLALNAWNLHITFATYPPPRCFDEARRYEAKIAEVQAMIAAKATPKPKKKKKPQPKEQLELWQDNGG